MPPVLQGHSPANVISVGEGGGRNGGTEEGRNVCHYLVAHCSGKHWGRWGQVGVRPCLGPLGRACKESLADQSEAPGPEPASCHKASRVRAYLQCIGIGTRGKTTTINTGTPCQWATALKGWDQATSSHQGRHIRRNRGKNYLAKSSAICSCSATGSTQREGAKSFTKLRPLSCQPGKAYIKCWPTSDRWEAETARNIVQNNKKLRLAKQQNNKNNCPSAIPKSLWDFKCHLKL